MRGVLEAWRSGAVGQDERVARGSHAPGGSRGILVDELAERVDLRLACDDPEEPADLVDLGIGQGHPADALVLAAGNRHPPVGHLEDWIAGNERSGVAVGTNPEV